MKLLVSVVDAVEARAAAAAGADIVDVKNPAEGSLGAPTPAVIAAVRDAVGGERPVSAAIGDMPNLPGTAALAALGAARSGATYVKVGLWGVSTEGAAVALLRAVCDGVPDEWRIVLVVPHAEPGLSGPAENQAFAKLVPSAERSAAIAQLVLTSLLPALVERDVEEFGAALTSVQQLVGDAFAPVQGGRFHPRAGALVEALLEAGAAGAGQSSWGPAVYGVVGSVAAGRELARRMEGVIGSEGSVELVQVDNRGARSERS